MTVSVNCSRSMRTGSLTDWARYRDAEVCVDSLRRASPGVFQGSHEVLHFWATETSPCLSISGVSPFSDDAGHDPLGKGIDLADLCCPRRSHGGVDG